jgi:hypothetical protein
MTTESVAPNTIDGAATQHNASISDESIFAKMAAMRDLTQRNQLRKSEEVATGESAQEANAESPVAPESEEYSDQPEVVSDDDQYSEGTDDIQAQDEPVSEEQSADTTGEDLIDFIEFAETNPNAKFKFTRNGKEVVIDAKKAAAILGQGGAIHEEARELKVQRAEFQEYEAEQRAKHEGLSLAMEFLVEPKIQSAYDEIIRTQNYQTTFAQQLAQATDPAQAARIQASMQQNERYIQQQGEVIRQLKPNVDEFKQIRRQQVSQILEGNRKAFQDKELRNEYVYNELRDKVSKQWKGANNELIPGVRNIDLISSDEHILGLIRDGLKYRDKPTARSAGASIAQLQNRKGTSSSGNRNSGEDLNQLREQAKSGDKRTREKAGDNLLVAQLNRLRSARRG